MDNKTIALTGALLVLGVAIYGMATGNLPGTDTLESDNNRVANNSSDNLLGGNLEVDNSSGGKDTGGNEAEMATNETGNVTAPEPLPVVCEDQGSDFSSEDLEVSSSDPLNTRLAESIIHDRMNELRASRSEGFVDPLKCDPDLRERAREHGQLVLIKEGKRGGEYITSDYEGTQQRIRSLGGELELKDNIGDISRDDVAKNSTEERYEGVCDEPVEEHGQFMYDVNIKGGSSGEFSFSGGEFGDDQELTRIDDAEDLARDARRHFLNTNLDAITDSSKTRQGIGIAIDRRTAEVVVTQVVCGPRNFDQTQVQNP